jgi:hypothetical protein
MPLLFVLSAAISGAGAVLLVGALLGGTPSSLGLAGVLAIIALSHDAWTRYRGWSSDDAYLHAVAPLRRRTTKLVIEGAGHGLPFALTLLALVIPAAAGFALAFAGLGLVAGQAYTKACLIREVGLARPITLRLAHPRRRAS